MIFIYLNKVTLKQQQNTLELKKITILNCSNTYMSISY